MTSAKKKEEELDPRLPTWARMIQAYGDNLVKTHPLYKTLREMGTVKEIK